MNESVTVTVEVPVGAEVNVMKKLVMVMLITLLIGGFYAGAGCADTVYLEVANTGSYLGPSLYVDTALAAGVLNINGIDVRKAAIGVEPVGGTPGVRLVFYNASNAVLWNPMAAQSTINSQNLGGGVTHYYGTFQFNNTVPLGGSNSFSITTVGPVGTFDYNFTDGAVWDISSGSIDTNTMKIDPAVGTGNTPAPPSGVPELPIGMLIPMGAALLGGALWIRRKLVRV